MKIFLKYNSQFKRHSLWVYQKTSNIAADLAIFTDLALCASFAFTKSAKKHSLLLFVFHELTSDANGSFNLHSKLSFCKCVNSLWWSKPIGSAAMNSSIPCFLALSVSAAKRKLEFWNRGRIGVENQRVLVACCLLGCKHKGQGKEAFSSFKFLLSKLLVCLQFKLF